MNLAAFRATFGLPVSPGARLVYLCLVFHANGDWRAWPSVGRLSDETAMHPGSVRRCLDDLEQAGAIDGFRQRGRVTIWTLNPAPGARTNPAPGARTNGVTSARMMRGSARIAPQKVRASCATEVSSELSIKRARDTTEPKLERGELRARRETALRNGRPC